MNDVQIAWLWIAVDAAILSLMTWLWRKYP